MIETTITKPAPLPADDFVHDDCAGWEPCHYCPEMIHHGDDYLEVDCPSAGLVYAHHVCYAEVSAGRRDGCRP